VAGGSRRENAGTHEVGLSECVDSIVETLGGPEPYIFTYIRCTYGIFSREITIHTVLYGVHIWSWPTLWTRQKRKWWNGMRQE
jgi:hypothetical protein